MYTNFHDDLLVFPNAQQDHVLIAQLSQGTVHGIELDDTLWVMMDNALNKWSEMYQMQYVHLPELGWQVRPKYDAQWLKAKRALREQVLEEVVMHARNQGICIDFGSGTSLVFTDNNSYDQTLLPTSSATNQLSYQPD